MYCPSKYWCFKRENSVWKFWSWWKEIIIWSEIMVQISEFHGVSCMSLHCSCVSDLLLLFSLIVLNWSFEPLTSLETGNGARVLLIYLYLRLYQSIIHLCWKSLNTCLVLVKSTHLIEKIDFISYFLRVQKVSKSTHFWNIF